MIDPTDQKLPRGRHKLPREFIIRSQRDRIMKSLVHEVAEHGFAGASVGAIVRRAGVSRSTFYSCFNDKQDAYFAAIQSAVKDQRQTCREILEGEGEPRDRARASLEVYLQRLAGDSQLARCLILERPPDRRTATAQEAHERAQSAAELCDALGFPSYTGALAYASIVDGWVADMVATDRVEELPTLAEPILDVFDLLLDAEPSS